MEILLNPLFYKHLLYHIKRREALQARRLFIFTTNYSPFKFPPHIIDLLLAGLVDPDHTRTTADCGYISIHLPI